MFGANYRSRDEWSQTWAMAELLRLFPDSLTMHPTDSDHQRYLRLAHLIEERSGCAGSTDARCFETLTFEEELHKLNPSPTLADFFRYLLVVDPRERPTAIEALGSKRFQSIAQR